MKNYMFGIDQQDPFPAARQLKDLGLGALVISRPTPEIMAAAEQNDLAVYLCFGAFSLTDEFSASSYWSRDYQDQPLQWFNSGCPNETAISQRQLEKAALLAATPGVKGVIVDGARFASPTPLDPLAFLTCFCPRCAKKAASYGLDLTRMQKAVASLADFSKNGNESILYQLGGLAEWLKFRELVIKDYFSTYLARLRQVNSQLELGAFIFPDSLSGLVGQTAAAVAELDLVCPMLYRRYEPSGQAPACLNHEWADLLLLLTKNSGLYPGQALSYLGQFAQLDSSTLAGRLTAASIRQDGFLPVQLTRETQNLVNKKAGPQVWPIIQLADEKLAESVAAVQAGQADGYGFFAYQKEHLAYLTAAVNG